MEKGWGMSKDQMPLSVNEKGSLAWVSWLGAAVRVAESLWNAGKLGSTGGQGRREERGGGRTGGDNRLREET